MSRKSIFYWALAALLGVLVLGLGIFVYYTSKLPDLISQHETILLGQSQLSPGSESAMRVLVRDSKDASPLAGAQIKISLLPGDGGKHMTLFDGTTNSQGTADIQFKVPDEYGEGAKLLIETTSDLGSDWVERPVTIERQARILLTTDKPIYQPGQVIHLRALALNSFDLSALSGHELEFVVADGKGNKVFRQPATTSEFGVAVADFQLADEVNVGDYKISATIGETTSEKTVSVKRYVLPKFAISLNTNRSFYLPGQRVQGTLQAEYFYGKPVAVGEVLLEGYTFDVERNTVFTIRGETNSTGDYAFEFDMPDFLTGTELEGGLGRFYLEASIVDQSNHSEISNLSIAVSGSPLVIEAIPESGQLHPKVDNILYVLTSYPDGTPAETDLSISSGNWSANVRTSPYGLAEVSLIPATRIAEIQVTARTDSGETAQRVFNFEADKVDESVLLRPDQPAYRVGETMKLTILATRERGTVYLDIVRAGQTVSTRSVEIMDGRAEVVVDLTPDLYGTLELHVYKILRSGDIVRDTRLVAVDNAENLTVSLKPDCPPERVSQTEGCIFRPGDEVGLDVQVVNLQGRGVRSALGLAIVDESVFALAEQDPGFERLYFLLEQELLEPKYDIHGFSVPDLMLEKPSGDQALLEAYRGAAFASLAEAIPQQGLFSLHANSHEDAIGRTLEIQDSYYSRLGNVLGLTNGLVSLVVAILGAIALARRRRFWVSLGLAILVWVAVGFLSVALVSTYFLIVLLPVIGIGLAIIALIGVIGILIEASARKDALLGWLLALILYYGYSLALFIFSAFRGSLSESVAYSVIVSLLLTIFSFTALVIGIGLKALRGPGNGAAITSLLLLAIILTRCAPAAQTTPPPPTPNPIFTEREKTASEPEKPDAPRLRQFFPETLLWLPDEVTNETGSLHLDFPAADSITTWRMTALASTPDGQLGSTNAGLRVFQDFFIDLDLPLTLTVGDQVAIPVGVFNYLPVEQSVRLELETADWFELLDQPVKELRIAANDIDVVYFNVRVLKFGQQPFQVTAWGSQMSDAILKDVMVYPDGKQIRFSQSDFLRPATNEGRNSLTFNIPAEAIPDTQSLLVKVYPGILSQVVEGLESMLRMPYGCFEQTSSTTYPNVLVLDYLKTTEQLSPEVQFKAENYINTGYQRLITFEVGNSGGFSLFGDPPADRMLTAFGLLELADMSRVHEVDPALLERTASWLFSQQRPDGSWENDRGLYHEKAWQSLQNSQLPVTAYITWSLIEAGFGDDPRIQNALAYVRDHQPEADVAYVMALAANALVAADVHARQGVSPITQEILDRLAEEALRAKGTAYWMSGVETFMGGKNSAANIETTSLAALALMQAGSHVDLANEALTYLVQQKDAFGTWYSTHATVMALKALIQNVRGGSETADAEVTLFLNGLQVGLVQITPENFDVVQLISLSDLTIGSENTLEIRMEGSGNLMYQVSGSYYLPWELAGLYPEPAGGEKLVQIEVEYDRTELVVDETVQVNVRVALTQPGVASSVLIDLGLPPGFTLQTEDLDTLVAQFSNLPNDSGHPRIERYELAGRQILIYASDLSFENPIEFSYRLKAKYPLRVQVPASHAYDYYNPLASGQAEPNTLVVDLQK